MTKMTVAVWCMVMALCVGCTPKMHRAYQWTMTGVGAVGYTQSALQTYAVLKHDPGAVESNWMLGEHPGPILLVGTTMFNGGLATGILSLPRTGPNALPDYAIDVLATLYGFAGALCAYNDTSLTDTRWWR